MFKRFIVNPIVLILILSYTLPVSFVITALLFIKLWAKSMQDTQMLVMQKLGMIRKQNPMVKKQ